MRAKDHSLVFRQLNPGACRTYFVGSEPTKEAALIDPVLDHVESYLKLLKEEGWALRFVIDTHTHADHLSGGTDLVQRTGANGSAGGRSRRTLGKPAARGPRF